MLPAASQCLDAAAVRGYVPISLCKPLQRKGPPLTKNDSFSLRQIPEPRLKLAACIRSVISKRSPLSVSMPHRLQDKSIILAELSREDVVTLFLLARGETL